MEENLKCNKGDSCDCMVPTQTSGTVFPRIIAGDDYFFFRTKKSQLFKGRQLFKILLAHRKLCPKYFIFPFNQKMITSNNNYKLNMGFLSVSTVVTFSELESSLISLAGSHCTST